MQTFRFAGRRGQNVETSQVSQSADDAETVKYPKIRSIELTVL